MTIRILFLIILSIFFVSCTPQTKESVPQKDTSMTSSTNVKDLEKFVTLPYAPVTAEWQIIEMGISTIDIGPKDWGIIAVLEFDPTIVEKIVASISQEEIQRDLFVNQEFPPTWLPSEISNKFVKVEKQNMLMLTTPHYSAKIFYKSPLNQGYVFQTGNFVFIYIHT